MNLSGLIFLLLFSIATAELRWVLLLKDKKLLLQVAESSFFSKIFFKLKILHPLDDRSEDLLVHVIKLGHPNSLPGSLWHQNIYLSRFMVLLRNSTKKQHRATNDYFVPKTIRERPNFDIDGISLIILQLSINM